MSGCEAAIAAAQRGHRVTLLEKSGQLGGQWIPASMPVGKSEFTSLLLWQKAMLEKLHIQVLLNTQADGELIRLYEPDAVVVATGSKPFVPGFLKGADQDFVVNAHDVLLGKVEVQGKVVVVGGGLVGAETADTLSQSCQVSVIEMQPRIMGDGEYSTAYYMKQRFPAVWVQVYTLRLKVLGDWQPPHTRRGGAGRPGHHPGGRGLCGDCRGCQNRHSLV